MTKIELINNALARLGERPIQSLTENSAVASIVQTVYRGAIQSALRDYNWSFAIREKELPRTEAKSHFYKFTYALPHDSLRVIRTLGNQTFAVQGNVLCSNEERVVIQYIADITDEELFDSKFIEAISYKLASELAMPVKGSSELMASYSNAYMNLVQKGASESANEQHQELSDNPYVDARW